MREKNDCLRIGHNVHTVICQLETVILLPPSPLHHAPAALLLPSHCWPVVVVLAFLLAFLLTCWPGYRLQLERNPTAGNPNSGNGIPDIRIPAYRKRSAFGFGIPPYDLLIPREIQKTDGYDRVATV